jgi:hypothetical protein
VIFCGRLPTYRHVKVLSLPPADFGVRDRDCCYGESLNPKAAGIVFGP